MIVPAILGAAALLGVAGRAYGRYLERRVGERFEHDPNGVIRGAEPIEFEGTGDAAVLLVHGGGDTPQTMSHLAAELQRRGYSVVAPLLPGHGRTLAAFDEHDADEWYGHVLKEFLRLRSRYGWVGVAGLSMGGALSVRLAAETGRVDALVLASPYLSMPPVGQVLARTARFWGPLVPYVDTSTERSVLDPQARGDSLAYGAFTRRSLRGLLITARRGWDALPSVTPPTLVMQSTTDNRIARSATEKAFTRLGASEKQIEWIEGAGHVITVDYGWQHVTARAADWMDFHRLKTKNGAPQRRPGISATG